MEGAESLVGAGLRGATSGVIGEARGVVCARVVVDGGGAEEAAEAGAGDFGRRVVVDVGLVVGEKGEFLFGEGVGFERDFEFVGRFDIGLQMLELAFVEGGIQIEGVVLAFLVSGGMLVGAVLQVVVEICTLCSSDISWRFLWRTHPRVRTGSIDVMLVADLVLLEILLLAVWSVSSNLSVEGHDRLPYGIVRTAATARVRDVE